MNWIPLTTEDQLLDIEKKSSSKPQVIFKHSTRCSTSSMVLNRLERSKSSDAVDFYSIHESMHYGVALTIKKLIKQS